MISSRQKNAGAYAIVAFCYGQILLVALDFFHPRFFGAALMMNVAGAAIFYFVWWSLEKWITPMLARKRSPDDRIR